MKLLFLSNYYTHHQKPLCEEWNRLTHGNFTFAATEVFSHERKGMGWSEDKDASFVLDCHDGYSEEVLHAIDTADAVVLGSAPLESVSGRLENKKTVFKYSERIFKNGYSYIKWLPRLYRFWRMYGRHKSLYLLSAGAYTTADFAMHGVFKNKSYKWGYFPETMHYDTEKLFEGKSTKRILWCGRFIDWKHPDVVIELASRLKADCADFSVDLMGTGDMESVLRQAIKERGLEQYVRILGAMNPIDVRREMEKAGIYVFTSDFREGWGAVLNEAMNSGCAVVASHAIGSVPFLIKHQKNGLIYKNGDTYDLYLKVKGLLEGADEQRRLGMGAYRTITELWNAELAAGRFVRFAEEIENKGHCDLYEDGPCSRATVIKNSWFKG